MKKLFLYVIGSLIILPVYSQHLIKGTIIDSGNAVMPMVNVAFLNQADSTLVTGEYPTLAGYMAHRLLEVTISSAILIWVMRHCVGIYKSMRISHCR